MRRNLITFFIVLCQAATLITAHAVKVASFSDVPQGAWYYNAITAMAQQGILSGYPDGTFRPDAAISSREFVAIIARIAEIPPDHTSSSAWADAYLKTAFARGWYDWDEIPPAGDADEKPISRQLAVKITMHALLPNAVGDYTTQSKKISDFSQLDGRYYDPVLAAYQCGVLQGDASGLFLPQNDLSRAEACAMVLRAVQISQGQQPVQPATPPTPIVPSQGGVSTNGRLQVIGTQLCNASGSPMILRGMSTHGLQWYGAFACADAIAATKAYGAKVFRIAMYTEEGGYLSRPALKNDVIAAVDAAIQNDMYVIVDWHILSDGNPMDHRDESIAFFTEIASRYRNSPHVLYEICNEPNGTITWENDVKPYAAAVIAAIRKQDTQAIILIGSPTWSQDLHLAAADPIEGANLMYTCHFYAGTHGAALRNRIDDALNQGIPIFVSEWGTSRADGGNGVYLNESETWLDFLRTRGISWCNWSLCDKDESSAALRPGTNPSGPWSQTDLSASGNFVFAHFRD